MRELAGKTLEVLLYHGNIPEEPVEQKRGMILAAMQSADPKIHEGIYELLGAMPWEVLESDEIKSRLLADFDERRLGCTRVSPETFRS